LALDVPVVSREIPEARGLDVDVVKLNQRFGEVLADGDTSRAVERRFGFRRSRNICPLTNSIT
jgi:hypothetical protein